MSCKFSKLQFIFVLHFKHFFAIATHSRTNGKCIKSGGFGQTKNTILYAHYTAKEHVKTSKYGKFTISCLVCILLQFLDATRHQFHAS